MAEQQATVAFTAFGLTTQVALVAYFAGRRWRPALADRLAWLVYALGLPSLLLGLALAASGFLSLAIGPLLFAAWAAFGYEVDRRRPVEWRSPPRWGVLVPYVTLLWLGLFGLWLPLRHIDLACFLIFGVLLAAHSALNLTGHFGRA